MDAFGVSREFRDEQVFLIDFNVRPASVIQVPSYMTLRGALRRRIRSTNHEIRNKLKDRQLNTGEK